MEEVEQGDAKPSVKGKQHAPIGTPPSLAQWRCVCAANVRSFTQQTTMLPSPAPCKDGRPEMATEGAGKIRIHTRNGARNVVDIYVVAGRIRSNQRKMDICAVVTQTLYEGPICPLSQQMPYLTKTFYAVCAVV
uniref:Uncharacterized protein n=1 Tax=Ascaris lumbricoides TaxID=6252 RepID=A0A0M3HSR8_ASCLU